MKILHTADWHIGQLFYNYDRFYEHEQFLHWLVNTLVSEEIDVLFVSGDVFDNANPSAPSIKLFYSFLNKAVKANPDLQIIVTAGNHDSASRLETPKPLLESSNIHIVGVIEKHADGSIDYDKLIKPIKDIDDAIKAWCLAVPFLRIGDYPVIADAENPYTEGVTAFYKQVYEHALTKRQDGQAIIAMGHLHAQRAEVGDMDKTERAILGGVECIAATAFDTGICYVALGHIHKAQRVGGTEHIRYCGSPLPMSFSEINYKHQVIVFELNDVRVENIDAIEIPVSVLLLRMPRVHSTMQEVFTALAQLPDTEDKDPALAPYLEVCVFLNGPEPALKHKIETALTGKYIRLAKIDVRYAATAQAESSVHTAMQAPLEHLNPVEVFSKIYKAKYSNDVPGELLQLFHHAAQNVSVNE
jgi:exonuclease SbcD